MGRRHPAGIGKDDTMRHLTTRSVPKSKRLATMFDRMGMGRQGVPFGRRADVLATVADHSTLAWQDRGGTWDDCDLVRYATREDALTAWRHQEAYRCLGERARIVLVQKDA